MSEPSSGRRRALEVIAGGSVVACAAVAAGPAVALVAASPETPPPGGANASWTRVARLSALVPARPARFAVIGAQVDAWVRAADQRLGAVWLVLDGGEGERAAVRAYSATCPHLGCGVELEGDHFVCRCHDSAFGPRGEARTGPSPRGLDPLDVRIEGGWVSVRFQRFRLGTSQRIEG